jgi:hypothetical protein
LAEGRREESTNIELVSLPPNKERKLIIRYCPGKVPMKPRLKLINCCILGILFPFFQMSVHCVRSYAWSNTKTNQSTSVLGFD